jgi:orotidine-5'-phosphate decarboxylase
MIEINESIRRKLLLRLNFFEIMKKYGRNKSKTLLKFLSHYFNYFLIDSSEMFQFFGARPLTNLINECGGKAFVDGKFYETGERLAKTSNTVSDFGAAAMSVSAISGKEAMMAAAAAVTKSNGERKLKIFAETIIDVSPKNSNSAIFGVYASAGIIKLAKLAYAANVDGIIIPAEFSAINLNTGTRLKKIVSGAITPWNKEGEKSRLNAISCLKAGADAVILGEDILFPPEDQFKTPIMAAQKIHALIEEL